MVNILAVVGSSQESRQFSDERFKNNTIEREFHGGYMTSKELFKAKEILKENNISASPIEFWETEKYYQIAYITYAGIFFIDRFNK